MSDFQRMKHDAAAVRNLAEQYLTKWWGERCPDTDESCHCCDKWMLLDALLENPFDDLPEPNLENITAARADFAAGRCQTPQEIIRELQEQDE